MTQLFNRIQQDIDILGGQPYIINTKITVREIIEKSLNGDPVQRILEVYPELSAEDIHQALSFAINDFLRGVSYWRHDAMTPLTQIKGYSEILVGQTDFGNLDTISQEQKQQWLSIIHSSSQRGIARWQQMSHWITNQYQVHTESNSEVYAMDWFIHSAVSYAKNYEPTLEIELSEATPILNIESHEDTTMILGSMLAYAKNTFHPQITINYTIKKQQIIIYIQRYLQYSDDDIAKLIATAYNPISTARKFFFAQQNPFLIEREDDTIVFTLMLPIWSDNDNELE